MNKAMEKMKFRLVGLLSILIVLSSCAVEKPYYQTSEGKKKQKYYNDIQFGRNANPKMKF